MDLGRSRLPAILLIDNDASERVVGVRQALQDRAIVSALDPSEVELDDISAVDLVSVDEFLGIDWAEFVGSQAHQLPVSVQNRDGLAVAAAIRSQVRNEIVARPLAVTLHTGEITKLAGPLPRASRESLVAEQHDLEWVFEFDAPDFPQRLLEVALAAQSIRDGARAVAEDFGAQWLALPGRSWADTAVAQIEDARPPAHSLADDTSGRSYLRWLAHKVLPYPTFLLNRAHAANLLGITVESFDEVESHADRYSGPLAHLLGPRWWRASLQQLLVDEDVDTWDPSSAKAKALTRRYGTDLVALSHDQAVVSYTAQGYVNDIDTDPEVSVRLQQDGWPVWADDPWATIEDVRQDGSLRRMVSRADEPRLRVN